jgi:hypothetical protein
MALEEGQEHGLLFQLPDGFPEGPFLDVKTESTTGVIGVGTGDEVWFNSQATVTTTLPAAVALFAPLSVLRLRVRSITFGGLSRCEPITEDLIMTKLVVVLSATAVVALLASCGGQPQQYGMQTPTGTPETVTVPKGTMLGGASAGDATALAKMIQDSNNNVMTAL